MRTSPNNAVARRLSAGFMVAALVCLPLLVQADTYRWKDKNGQVHFGESLPVEYANSPYDIINDAGMVVEHVDHFKPEPPPVEKVVEDKPRERQSLIPIEERKRQADRFLLIQYKSEADISHALELELAQLTYDSKLIYQSFNSANTAIENEIRDLADQQRSGQAVKPEQQQKIDSLYKRLANDRRKRDSLSRREKGVRDRFQATLERYRYLTSKNKAPATTGPD